MLGGLFDKQYLDVISPECGLKLDHFNTVKLMKGSSTKETAKSTSISIACSSLFPSDLEQVTLHIINRYGVSRSLLKDLIKDNYGDLCLIHNQIVLNHLAGDIGTKSDYSADAFKTINYFIDGHYGIVSELINSPSFPIVDFVWAFAGFLSRIFSVRTKKKPSWYEGRLREVDRRLNKVTLEDLIKYVSGLTSNFLNNESILRLNMGKLIYHLRTGTRF
jgi:hypothetical protein